MYNGVPFYMLADGRIWNVARACFVDSVPDGGPVIPLYDGETPANVEYLRKTLEFYGYPIGPELMNIEEVKAAKLAEINAACDAFLSVLTASYPANEVLTFDQQKAEAEAVLADPSASAPLLTPLAAARGLSVTELAQKVLVKTEAFTTISGHVIGQRQKYEDMLDEADTVPAVVAIVPEYTMPESA